MKLIHTLVLGAILLGSASTQAAAETAESPDPLDSARWQDMQRQYLPQARISFDPRVRVSAPGVAEDPLQVPVTVDASALPDVRQVLVIADFNPYPLALRFTPRGAKAFLGFRLKLQQSSPVRAAALDGEGVWHVGGVWVNTTGGGCSLPAVGSGSPEWQQRLNQVSGRLWDRGGEGERLRLRLIHPMDTGLAAGIPAFYLQEVVLADAAGGELMHIDSFEPVSENPVFTLDLPPGTPAPIQVRGRDNNGNQVASRVAP
ncbi:MAG: quinoprotein dehydrogenase-associated SoxYZ-like carrier [Betaproteobacteria bacterium]|nr:quinoprotein dehydrogenase-associated SoxYZ-like carrier [Betaproteobacteria bacterium]